jgi:hypothetical protein
MLSVSKKCLTIPNKYLQKKSKDDKLAIYKSWKNGLPFNWISSFLENGLLPFLNENGYSCGIHIKELSKYCTQWAFAHVYMDKKLGKPLHRTFTKCMHNGGNQELQWFLDRICFEDWSAFANTWATDEFLDDSSIGQNQLLDLPYFCWQVINLDGSKAHWDYLDFMGLNETNNDEDINYYVSEEPQLYEGQRKAT